jgi:aerobic-type carbon monoxide dehydrogenase small subunit (CoxS/CutS family)
MGEAMMNLMTLQVNGETVHVACPPHETLLETLRERLDLIGTKHGCELGECGACAVLRDGEPVLSCLVLTAAVQGHALVTIEGVAQSGVLHPLQTSLAELGAAQCGYCMPGIVVTAKALLDRNPSPSRQVIREALAGNLCRCTGYVQIVDAVALAAARLREAQSA